MSCSRLAADRRALLIFTVVLSLVAGFTAVSRESLWIDEANSALKAMQPSLASWWGIMLAEKGSDLQMPLYMLHLWVWEKFFGHTEFALRSVNILWFCIGQVALCCALRRHPRAAALTVLLGAISPILWFYLNDARPYAMQYAGACLLCYVLFRAAEDPPAALRSGTMWLFGIGILILCGSSLLGVIWAGGITAAWLFLLRNDLSMVRLAKLFAPIAATLSCLTVLAGYYAWTLWLGTGASGVGNTRLLNLAFISYEFSGIAGLGPGRLQIRQDGFAAFFMLGAVRLGVLIAVAILALGIFCWGLWSVGRSVPRRGWIAMLIYAFPPGLFLIGLGYMRDFRLLGRHFVPLVPLALGLLAFGIARLGRRRTGVATGAIMCVIWLVSCLSLRFSGAHRKDDYRTAAEIATTALAQQEEVWWSADQAAASYYGVPVRPPSPHSKGVVLIIHPDREQLAALAPPDIVIASKPDIYEGGIDALGPFLAAGHYLAVRDLPAFTIWRKAATPAAE